MSDHTNVTSADFIRNIGYWQSEALRHPIVITHHGRERLVLAAPENFSGAAAPGAKDDELAALKSAHAAVLDHLEEGLLVLDAELRVIMANRVALAFCSRDAESIRAVPIVELMPQPLASVLYDRTQRVLRARKSESFEASTFDERCLSVCVFPLGASVGVLFYTLTATATLRRRLEEGDALAAAAAQHTQAAVIKLDARARIEMVDASFCVLSGFAGDDLVGHRFVDLVSPQHRRDTAELFERTLRERTPSQISLVLLGRRGEEHPGVLAAAPILTDFVAHGVMAVWTPAAGAEALVSAA